MFIRGVSEEWDEDSLKAVTDSNSAQSPSSSRILPHAPYKPLEEIPVTPSNLEIGWDSNSNSNRESKGMRDMYP